MGEHRASRRAVLGSVGAAVAVGLAGCPGLGQAGGGDGVETTGSSDGGGMTAFHAGSLGPPFSAAEADFEGETGADVTREVKGSVASTKKVTELGRTPDVLGVSDFRLIRDQVLSEYADWYAVFAMNAMAIQYRDDSPGADDIATDNWWEVLSREDVTIGHSDPAVDPGGYRAVMVQQLGAVEFEGERLYDDATYQRLRENSTVPTGTETNLTSQLEGGKLDYVVYYRSITETTDLPSVDLQPHVNLARVTDAYADHYANATVETDAGTFTGAPIAYGITVPSDADSPDLGARWVEHFATDRGRETLRDTGFRLADPVIVPAAIEHAVPDRLLDVVRTADSIGPLEL